MDFKCLNDQTLEKLRSNRIGKCKLIGVHTYDLLRNEAYVQAFQYVSPSIPDREKYIKDGDDDNSNNEYQSDLVRLVLNLAYMTKKEVEEFSFDRDCFMRRKGKCEDDKRRNHGDGLSASVSALSRS